MTKAFYTWALISMSSASLVFSTTSCSKKDDGSPTPTTTTTPAAEKGYLRVYADPANSLESVTATSSTGQVLTATVPAAGGYFEFNTILVGTYTVAFTPTLLFNAPASQSIAVPKSFSQGTNFSITVTPTGKVPAATFTGTMGWASSYVTPAVTTSCSVDGAIRNTQELDFYGVSNALADASGNSRTETVYLTIPKFHGLGTYPIPSEATSSINVRQLSSGSIASYRGTSGSLIITSFNPTSRTVTGTFSFGATSTTSTNTLSTTSGTISVSY